MGGCAFAPTHLPTQLAAAGPLISAAGALSPPLAFGSWQFRSNPAGLRRVCSFHLQYDETPDGQRFVMIRNPGAEEGELIVVASFFEELRERVGN